jgi:hypothetical protein
MMEKKKLNAKFVGYNDCVELFRTSSQFPINTRYRKRPRGGVPDGGTDEREVRVALAEELQSVARKT